MNCAIFIVLSVALLCLSPVNSENDSCKDNLNRPDRPYMPEKIVADHIATKSCTDWAGVWSTPEPYTTCWVMCKSRCIIFHGKHKWNCHKQFSNLLGSCRCCS